ncbi:unnamed protein product [Paramecium sonneborni]|uniref:Uncharacterized protein n=1 Tax=Paramecium sonneborni TaxID=65129 RepID=A0A8S1QWL1_9CILI|nr:unnamed protein product [Paramecium sonneborni]
MKKTDNLNKNENQNKNLQEMARSQIIKIEDIPQGCKSTKKFSNVKQTIMDDYRKDRKKVGRWTPEEDQKLQKLIEEYGDKNWRKISEIIEGRNPIQCLHRWTKILKPGLKKGAWEVNEDNKLLEWVKNNGACKWSLCADNITGRSGKQCRERWFNNLNPDVKKGGWTSEEDHSIFKGYLLYSSSWSKIAKNLIGRTENSVKNRFYSTVRKLLADQDRNEISLQILELQCENGTSALQTFVKEHMQLLEQQIQIKMEEDNPFQNQLLQHNIQFQKELQNDTHQTSNLLYTLLQQQGIPIKKTTCMKDYSTIYKKYQQRYNQRKKNKKLFDKIEKIRDMQIIKENFQSPYPEQEFNFKQYLKIQLDNFQKYQAELQSEQMDKDKMDEIKQKFFDFFSSQLDEIINKFNIEEGNDINQSMLQNSNKQFDKILKQVNNKNINNQIITLPEVKQDYNTFQTKFIQSDQNSCNNVKIEIINFMNQNQKIDPKIMFLIGQLHTLENILDQAKKEFSRQESILYDKIYNSSLKNRNSNHSN